MNRTLTVFFDADVLIAGSASTTGASFLLLQLAELFFLKGLTSRQVIDESERNLTKKLPQSLALFRQIVQQSLTVVADPTQNVLKKYHGMAHLKDLPILAAAMINKSDVLLTFNVRHFHPKSSLLSILSPGDLLAEIRNNLSQIG